MVLTLEGGQPITTGPRVEAPPTLVVAQLVVAHPVMSIEKKKMLSTFFMFGLPKFFCAPSEYAYELLIDFENRLHNFGIIKTRCLDYTHFKLDLVA